MDRRDFLKRTVVASVFAELALEIVDSTSSPQDECYAIQQAVKGKIGPTKRMAPSTTLRTGSVATGRMICGGNLFNGFTHARESLDGADLRLQRVRLSQTGFLAGWQPVSDLGSQILLWKGAY